MRAGRGAVALGLVMMAGTASAQSDTPWAGGYAGINLGRATNGACAAWSARSAVLEPASATSAAFGERSCPRGAAVGGTQAGYDFQDGRLLWGLEAEYEAGTAMSQTRSLKYSGAGLPHGTYDFADHLGPGGFGIVASRFGYAGLQWLPYLEGGMLVAVGSRDSTVSYVASGSSKPSASFNGGRNFSTVGWVAGGGLEYGFNGPWSVRFDYLHVSLGKGGLVGAACNGAVSGCAAFSGVSFEAGHGGFTASLARIGINYWFGYWDP